VVDALLQSGASAAFECPIGIGDLTALQMRLGVRGGGFDFLKVGAADSTRGIDGGGVLTLELHPFGLELDGGDGVVVLELLRDRRRRVPSKLHQI